MSEEYKQKVNNTFAILDQAAALRRGARELPKAHKKKLKELKEALRKSGSETPAENKKTEQQ